MKYVKTFENFDNSEDIKKYLEDKYSEEWFNEQLDERAPDYAGDDWEEDGYESESDWYQNHACGGAIEYDLLDEISKDVQKTFGLTYDQADPYVKEIFHKNCHWKDSYVFGDRSSDYNKDFDDLMSKFNDLNESIEISTLDLISAWLVYNNIKKYGFTQTLKNMGNNLTDWMANFIEFATTMYGEPVSSEITEYKFKELLNRFRSK